MPTNSYEFSLTVSTTVTVNVDADWMEQATDLITHEMVAQALAEQVKTGDAWLEWTVDDVEVAPDPKGGE
jgi:hypothetical protein